MSTRATLSPLRYTEEGSNRPKVIDCLPGFKSLLLTFSDQTALSDGVHLLVVQHGEVADPDGPARLRTMRLIACTTPLLNLILGSLMLAY